MRHPNLFQIPTNESVIDSATNGKFTLGSLIGDFKHKDEGPKTEMDKVARHFIAHGEIPASYRQKLEQQQKPNSEGQIEPNENIKEEVHMPFFRINEECACGKKGCDCGQGVSTGVAQGDGNVYKIGINQYQQSDSNFVGDGDDPETSKHNIPSILAARTAGGNPHPETVSNGINKHASNDEVFRVKPVADPG
jgi:hypothetical protein